MKYRRPRWLLIAPDPTAHTREVAEEACSADVDVLELNCKLFRTIADTVTSQGILSVFPIPQPDSGILEEKGVYVLLDGVSDPGNLGTIIRSAAAFGCRAVITGKGSCCPFIPKVTRASAGTNGRIPIFMDVDLKEFMNMHGNGMSFIGADAGGSPMESFRDHGDKLGVVVGSEARGISSEIIPLMQATVSIPMEDRVESLNAGVSASIILYQATRL